MLNIYSFEKAQFFACLKYQEPSNFSKRSNKVTNQMKISQELMRLAKQSDRGPMKEQGVCDLCRNAVCTLIFVRGLISRIVWPNILPFCNIRGPEYAIHSNTTLMAVSPSEKNRW